MVDKTLSYLDYLKLVEIIFHFSSTPFIDDSIHQLKPLSNKTDIEERQDRIEAILEVIKWDGKIPLGDIPDIRDVLKRISVGDSILEAQDFILVTGFVRASEDILAFLKKAYNKKAFVIETQNSIKQLPLLFKKISRAINPEGFIEDSASYELSQIRTELFSFREKMKRHLEKIMEKESVRPLLQDSYISLRNNRYVIPLKPNFNEALQGIVHDYSHSLKTSFVEPVECVELNNSINVLVNEEKEEEKKVLKDLTDFVRGFRRELEANLSALKELDLYHSVALFSLEFRCVRPQIGEEGFMEIKDAVNPFIILSKRNKAVPIDIAIAADKRAMIISGPNAGGKTAALKTIGLLCLMAKAGLFVPASGTPILPLFSNVFALIGDEQDIAMELSSFTAHMYAIKELYKQTAGNELILIDEIGGGTEPQEASALAMGIIDALVEKGCKVVVTTHLNLIKAYGYTKPFAMNVATAFDSDAMKPLYKLVYGTAGYSNAIQVAKNIDVPYEIIEKSRAYLGNQEFMLNDLITSLEQEKRVAGEQREELMKLRAEAKTRLALIKESRDEYLKKVDERCNSRLAELEMEIDKIRKEIAKKERIIIATSRKRVEDLRQRFGSEIHKKQADIHVGDYVRVKTLGGSGYVVDMDERGDTYEVVIGNVRTKLKRIFIEKTTGEKHTIGRAQDEVHVETINESELNLMGMRVEEALTTLDRFLDRAIVEGIPRVRILHGIGTGKLMQAIREHLTGAKHIRALHRDERNSGITIVEF
ncbi:MAG TPA: endonuclease MutS2 [Syntrophorhabdaceae bacterium]|nr:endonuclease MutS2 [Syntrophorhabdaceae bacterium]